MLSFPFFSRVVLNWRKYHSNTLLAQYQHHQQQHLHNQPAEWARDRPTNLPTIGWEKWNAANCLNRILINANNRSAAGVVVVLRQPIEQLSGRVTPEPVNQLLTMLVSCFDNILLAILFPYTKNKVISFNHPMSCWSCDESVVWVLLPQVPMMLMLCLL